MNLILIFSFIFISALCAMLLNTFDDILYAKGYKFLAALNALIVSAIHVLILDKILKTEGGTTYGILLFAFASGLGLFIGSRIEKKVGLGESLILAVVDDNSEVKNYLREKDNAVTSVKATGNSGNKELLFIVSKRGKIAKIISYIKKKQQSSVIFIEEVKRISGGYLK